MLLDRINVVIKTGLKPEFPVMLQMKNQHKHEIYLGSYKEQTSTTHEFIISQSCN